MRSLGILQFAVCKHIFTVERLKITGEDGGVEKHRFVFVSFL
jgi:hypothetical protein